MEIRKVVDSLWSKRLMFLLLVAKEAGHRHVQWPEYPVAHLGATYTQFRL